LVNSQYSVENETKRELYNVRDKKKKLQKHVT
jgi:hypothetical protein